MKFIISTTVAQVDDLAKAAAGFSRGPRAGFKYIKRVPYFAHGKMKWRYFYADETARKHGRQQHDPHDEHEHRLIHEQAELHPNLADKVIETVHAVISKIADLFGFGKKPAAETTKAWHEKRVKPHLEAEKAGQPPSRSSAMTRVHTAIEMLPDYIKEMIDPDKIAKGSTYKGLKKFVLNEIEDEEPMIQVLYPGLLGWANQNTGELHVLGSSFQEPIGQPRYGSSLTLGEEVVWHETGHHVHFALENYPSGTPEFAAIERWKTGLPGQRITAYAHSNWREDFAETFACALSHPKELALKCPERYDWMRDHVLKTLPTRDELFKTSNEELAWWEAKHDTPASELLRHLRHRLPSAPFHNYYSDQDQFFSVHKDGRTLYLRFGPANKEEEDGWDRMPPTVEEVTVAGEKVQVPVYWGALGARFKKTGSLKEIYDENGRALSDKQAFFYLGQDDAKVIAKAEEAGKDVDKYIADTAHAEEQARRAAEGQSKKRKKKGEDEEKESKNDTSLLSYQMYIGLGWTTSQTKEAELDLMKKRKARYDTIVAKQKKGQKLSDTEKETLKDGPYKMERHEWVPVEVSEQEFIEKSGTFKFGKMKPAAEQTMVATEPDTRAVITKLEGGKRVPVLTARTYEQENPDGTFTRIQVSESAPFSLGETISVPAGENGEWVQHTLKRGDPLDPYQLARRFKTSAKELLYRNGQFDRGQITDPILAALINPNGKQIFDEGELTDLMRLAALDRSGGIDPVTGEQYGRRAWVTFRDTPAHDGGIGHIQVEWDGLGPPKVVGDYWAKTKGKSEIRVDELLNKRDEIDVPRIIERAPKQIPLKPGAIVRYLDPKKDKWAIGTVITKDGSTFQIQPREKQVGVSKTLVAVTSAKVRTVDDSFNPDNPDVRRRFVEPLEKHVLLYMDDVPRSTGVKGDRTGGEDDPNGVIKVLLPKDGSISLGQMEKIDGVRLIKPGEGQTTVQITISAEDIPKFREQLGGFVMDSRVLAKLKELDTRTRASAEKMATTQVVEASDLEDQYGNINPDGPLKKLVLGDEGIQPGEHRIRCLQKLAKSGGRLYAAHGMGTGKTALAIMAGEMMRNLTDKETGQPHPKQLKKRCIYIGPPNTIQNWAREFVKFASPATVLGTAGIPGALRIPELPSRGTNESDAVYRKRAIQHWKDACKESTSFWNPWSDSGRDVIIGHEYFRDHGEALRLLNDEPGGLGFDGVAVDEAHKVANENLISKELERWTPKMNMVLMLSGTPIKNRLDVIPRIVELTTAGEVKLGTPEEFADRYLVASNVLKSAKRKNPPKTDLNPQRVGELMAILQPIMDVATSADVKGKSMPAVLLDENEPAHMIGQQARMYQAAMAALTPEDAALLETSAAVGADEKHLLSEAARAKVAVARGIANCPAYKAPDQSEFALYEANEIIKKGKNLEVKRVKKPFELPTLKQLTGKRPSGWGGKWPTDADVKNKIIDPDYYQALTVFMDRILGVTYESIAGKQISKSVLDKIEDGSMITVSGEPWTPAGGKLKNPEYGPEGMLCRGMVNEATGAIEPITTRYFDSQTGKWREVVVPVGKRFIRDPNTKSAGLYYDEDDWDSSGSFTDSGEDDTAPGEDETEEAPEEGWLEGGAVDEESADGKKPGSKRKKGVQGPKEGLEGFNVNRHPARRRERAMFDALVTTNNAKCDKLEQNMRNIFKSETGDGPREQLIIFGNRIGSSCRTAEAKLRAMGYMDINEALGNAAWSSDADKKRAQGTHKFFVSYMGKGATLGDRDINSEIFRRQQDEFGKDTGVSMFVWRTLYGSESNKMPKPGQMKEPWSRQHRKKIKALFASKGGEGLEVPMRVLGVKTKGGQLIQRYVYESDVSSKVRAEVRRLEDAARSQRGAEQDATEARIVELLTPFATDRLPLTDAQIDIFNNCQVMVASDAANVGLNWPANHLVMYDSLFSPMEEKQRIARAARMLPPSIRGQARDLPPQVKAEVLRLEDEAKKQSGAEREATEKKIAKILAPYPTARDLIYKVGAYINAKEKENGFKEYEGVDSAMMIVKEAVDNALSSAEQRQLNNLPGGAPYQILEAWFAQRALDKIDTLRAEVGVRLRREGAVPDPTKPMGPDNFIEPKMITESDVANEIIRKHLTPFDREILKSRRYLVDVKRLTTSVDMPVFVTVKNADGTKTRVRTGDKILESPNKAERAQLVQGRAKEVPFEHMMKQLQSATPVHTPYAYIPAYRRSFASFSRLPDQEETGRTPAETKKSMFYVRRQPTFYVRPYA